MRRRRILIVLVACILVGIGLVAFRPVEPEPQYNGKKLNEWLAICRDFRGADYSQLQSAQDAVRKIGTNGLPCLVKWLSYDTPKWKSALLGSKYNRWVPNSIGNLIIRPTLQAQRAREGFHILGTVASPAIPDLARMTDHWPGESWRAAIVALRSFEADGLPTLVTIATNHARPLEVRRLSMQAVASLHTVETYESWVVPAILPCLKEEGMEQATVVALGSLRIPPEFALPVLTNAVVSKRAEVRVWAVVALGRYGSQATPAVPVLLHAVHDPDPRVQQEATDTLKAIAPEVLTNGVKNF